jgi:hypothetical protein
MAWKACNVVDASHFDARDLSKRIIPVTVTANKCCALADCAGFTSGDTGYRVTSGERGSCNLTAEHGRATEN